MAGRQAHGHAPSKKSKLRNKSNKRALDAFSIASHQNPEKLKVPKHRLGEQEGGNRPGKRHRNDDNDDDDDEYPQENTKKQRKGPTKGRFDELDVDEGSDSEGNEWKLGHVDTDDDSDVDSDEAFGESDEERFAGFAFSGSSKKSEKEKSTPRSKGINLDEGDGNDSDSELEEGDLGEDAVDLADMLDASEEEAGEVGAEVQGEDEDSLESDEGEESDDMSSVTSVDDGGVSDPAKIAALQNLIANLPQAEEPNQAPPKQRHDGASEYKTPSDFGLTSKTKLTLEDLGLPTISDPHIKKSLKYIESNSKTSAKKKGIQQKLEVPLSKREQDRLDRSAAYDKAKETLDRWTDTVQHNRKADHLMFPLPDHDTISAKSNTQLVPTSQAKPFNELEATIQTILEESGLAAANGKDDEDVIREFEELEEKKMSIEEVKARRAQLRMARELLFREEAKAKRIKKIKSKSYRKVHRKQREKEELLNREALEEGGYVPSEDELEAQDRRRATERMGAKHRGSKWAKATKEIGRAAWDEDARAGITEMARRDEELRKRVEGKAVRKEFEDGSDASFTDSDSASEDGGETEQDRISRKLDGVGRSETFDASAPGGKLSNMKFMLKAEEARRKENAAMVEDIRRDLAGEHSDGEGEEEAGDVGRRSFGPGVTQGLGKVKPLHTSEFEEPEGSENDEDQGRLESGRVDNGPGTTMNPSTIKKMNRISNSVAPRAAKDEPVPVLEGGAWSKVPQKSTGISETEAKKRRHQKNNTLDIDELDLSKAAMITTQQPSIKSTKKSSGLQMAVDSDESNDEDVTQLPFAIRDQELVKRAFAGADVVGEFEAEKKQTVEDEDDQIIDNTLPGWGSWTGKGVSKRDKARNKGRFLTKVEGIKEKDRKDTKLDRVIINEKRVKKNVKYLASTLPHPFETKQQYERSLRLPVGPEWATKETYQEATKPRVLLKQGIIAPMSKPLM